MVVVSVVAVPVGSVVEVAVVLVVQAVEPGIPVAPRVAFPDLDRAYLEVVVPYPPVFGGVERVVTAVALVVEQAVVPVAVPEVPAA